MAIIKINNLSFKYHNSNEETLDDINLTIENNKWISIMGHNGSGKSTLAKILVGLLGFKKGQVIIDDLELNEDNLNEIRKKIGIIFQNPDHQFVGMTVRHDIAFGLENNNVQREEMIKLIEEYSALLDIKDLLDKEPHNLSGGQKQRVAIAGALARGPKILIFDEATSMLDPKGRNEVNSFISKLKKESNKTLITITHDINTALLSDQIIILNKGKIVFSGDKKDLLQNLEILSESNLELPLLVKLYKEVNNKEVKDLLWELILKM